MTTHMINSAKPTIAPTSDRDTHVTSSGCLLLFLPLYTLPQKYQTLTAHSHGRPRHPTMNMRLANRTCAASCWGWAIIVRTMAFSLYVRSSVCGAERRMSTGCVICRRGISIHTSVPFVSHLEQFSDFFFDLWFTII